jgi:single-stranded-DNA-specific exonuclease
LAALLAVAGVDKTERVDEGHLGYKLGPRINAPGRLGPAEPALELLRARTPAEADPLAARIETLNATRKRHSERTAAEAMAILAADPRADGRAGLVVAHDRWLSGIVGISAARLAEHYRRPALVIAVDPPRGVGRGSVRRFGGIDVRGALAECSALLERFGGHREAAGVTVAASKVAELTEAFDAAVRHQRDDAAAAEDVEVVDAVVPLGRVDFELLEGIRRVAPYGVGFAAPRFCIGDAILDKVRILKDRHLQLTLTDTSGTREAIAFGQSFHGLSPGERVGCIFAPINDRFRGEDRLRLHIERLWRV